MCAHARIIPLYACSVLSDFLQMCVCMHSQHVLWTVVCENSHTEQDLSSLLAIHVFHLSVVSFSQFIGSILLKQAGRVNLGSTSLHGEGLGFQFLK